MKTLILGSGGREHALAWKLAEELGKEQVVLHPGNSGTYALGLSRLEGADIKNPQSIVQKAREMDVKLVIIGPEALLAEGYGDQFRKEGFLVVGPNKTGAQLETSKVFAKEFMARAGVPTAEFTLVDSAENLLEHPYKEWPTVLKLDGLAAGKGVVIANSLEDVRQFADRVWKDHEFGPPPHRVVIESCLKGSELSYMGLCDGNRFIPLATATDYKRVGNNNAGGNTGGMGSISPSPYFTVDLQQKIEERVVQRILNQLQKENLAFRGVLYIGLMISPEGDPYVLEFNTRFGDPEIQAIVLRFKRGFVSLLEHTARGNLDDCPSPVWESRTSLYVVAAAKGYPGKVVKGDKISGLENLPQDIQLFYSGVAGHEGGLTTNGGRVLGLGALADSTEAVREKVYEAIKKVQWNGLHYRTDIGL